MATFFQGGTFDEQNKDPVIGAGGLLASGQYRDIPRSAIQGYLSGKVSQEDTIAAIKGTPIFNPTLGPVIDVGQGPRTQAGQLVKLNPSTNQYEVDASAPIDTSNKIMGFNASGQGFTTGAALKNQATYLKTQADTLQANAPQLGSTIAAPQVAGTSTSASAALSLPNPTAPALTSAYMASAAGNLASAKAQLENTYNTNLQDLKDQEDQLNQRINGEQGALSTLQTSNYQQQLEATLEEKYQVQENFDANQKSIAELDSIMTASNAKVSAAQATTGLASIKNPTISQIQADATARVGVIQAVMAARNNQISTAQNLIKDAMAAVVADHNDQVTYYTTLLSADQKGLLNLQADEKTYVGAKIDLLKSTVDEAQKTVDFITSQMTDPKTAAFMESSGVTLNDTVDQIQQKMAAQSVIDDRRTLINDMGSKGYTQITAAQARLSPGNTETQIDKGGNPIYFQKPASTSTTLNDADKAKLINESDQRLRGAGTPGKIPLSVYLHVRSDAAAYGLTAVDFDKEFSYFLSSDDKKSIGG